MSDYATSNIAPSQGALIFSDLVNSLFADFLGPIVDAVETFLRVPTPASLLTFEEGAQKILARLG